MKVTYSINLMDMNKKHAFDVFVIESDEEMHCYRLAVATALYDLNCTFLNDPRRAFLMQKSFAPDYEKESSLSSLPSFNQTIIIDNTEFPVGGAYVYGPVSVLS